MLMTKQEFAEKVGVSVPVLNTWIYRHGLPVIQFGRRTYIDETDYRDWVQSHKTILTIVSSHSKDVSLPTRCQKTSLATKMQRIY